MRFVCAHPRQSAGISRDAEVPGSSGGVPRGAVRNAALGRQPLQPHAQCAALGGRAAV